MAFDEAKFRSAAKAAGYSDDEIDAELKAPAGAAQPPAKPVAAQMDDTFAEKEKAMREEYDRKVKQATTSEISIGDRKFEIPSFFTSPAGIVTAAGAGIGLASTLYGAGTVAPKVYQSVKDRWMTKVPEIDRTVDIPFEAAPTPTPNAAPTPLPQTNLTPEDLRSRASLLKTTPVVPEIPPQFAPGPVMPAGDIPSAPPYQPISTPLSAAPIDAPAPTPSAAPNSPVTSIVTDTIKELIQEAPAQPVTPQPVAPPALQPAQNLEAPSKEIKRFNDEGVEVGYKRGDSKILVTVAPASKNDRMLSASLENIGGYPSKTGDATMAYVDALESVVKNPQGKPVYWDGFTSETIQSDKARAIYDRLKAAGIPFEHNVFNDQSKNALSLTQQQLFDIDFDQVRRNLIKNASQPVSPPQELLTGTGKPAFAGQGPAPEFRTKGKLSGEPKLRNFYADIAEVPTGYAFVPGAQNIDTPRTNLGQVEYTKAYTDRPFPLTNEMAVQESNEINRLLGRPTRAEAKAAGITLPPQTPGITKAVLESKASPSMGTKAAKVGGVLGALIAIPDLAKAETAGQRGMAGANLLEAVLPPGFTMSGAGEGSAAVPSVNAAMLLGSPYAQSEIAKKRRQQEEYTRKVGAGRGIAPPSAYLR